MSDNNNNNNNNSSSNGSFQSYHIQSNNERKRQRSMSLTTTTEQHLSNHHHDQLIKRSRYQYDPSSQQHSDHTHHYHHIHQQQQQSITITRAVTTTYLPIQVLYLVMSHFTDKEILRLGRVNQMWRRASRVNLLWKEFHVSHFSNQISQMDQLIQCLSTLFLSGCGSHSNVVPITQLYLSEMQPYDHTLFHQLIQMCPRLEQVSFPMIRTLDHSVTDAIISQMPMLMGDHLIRVHLSTHRKITDQGILSLANRCHRLESIDVDHCELISAEALVHLASQCHQLKHLSALYCNRAHFSSNQLLELSKHCSHLETVGLEWSQVDDPNAVYQFVKSAKHLKQLHIRGAVAMNGDTITHMVSHCSNLQHLTVTCAQETTRIINPTFKSQSLLELSVSHCEALTGVVIQCPNLKKLRIDSVQSFHCSSIEREHNSALSEIILSSSRLDNFQPDQFLQTERLPNSLERIELFDCTGIGRLNIVSPLLKELKLFLCNDMEELSVHCEKMTTFSVNACMQLQKVTLDCDSLTDCVFFPLVQAQPPILDTLILNSSSLDVLSLPKCTNLRNVTVSCSKLTAINMSEFKMLEFLNLRCPKLQKLALSAPRMNFDAQFSDHLVESCPEVNMFHISNTPTLGDQSLQRVCSGWPKLTALIIANCHGLRQPSIPAPLLKGLQFCECSNLVLPALQCPMLRKLSFKDTHSLCDEALSVLQAGSPELHSLEVTNCSSIRCPFISIAHLVDLQLNNCSQMTHLVISMACLRLNKLSIVGAVNLQHIGVAKPFSLQISEIILNQCHSLNDSAFQYLLSLCPNVKMLTVIGCNSLHRPSFSIQGLRLLQFIDCLGLVAPVIESNMIQSVSFKGCINLEVNNLAQVVRPVVSTFPFPSQRPQPYPLDSMPLHHPYQQQLPQQLPGIGTFPSPFQNMMERLPFQSTFAPLSHQSSVPSFQTASPCFQVGQIEIIGAKLAPCLSVPMNVGKLILAKCNRLQRIEINSNTLTCLIVGDCHQLQQIEFQQAYVPPNHNCMLIANRTQLSSVSGTRWITNFQVSHPLHQ